MEHWRVELRDPNVIGEANIIFIVPEPLGSYLYRTEIEGYDPKAPLSARCVFVPQLRKILDGVGVHTEDTRDIDGQVKRFRNKLTPENGHWTLFMEVVLIHHFSNRLRVSIITSLHAFETSMFECHSTAGAFADAVITPLHARTTVTSKRLCRDCRELDIGSHCLACRHRGSVFRCGTCKALRHSDELFVWDPTSVDGMLCKNCRSVGLCASSYCMNTVAGPGPCYRCVEEGPPRPCARCGRRVRARKIDRWGRCTWCHY
jgi:hypothetical protein